MLVLYLETWEISSTTREHDDFHVYAWNVILSPVQGFSGPLDEDVDIQFHASHINNNIFRGTGGIGLC